MTRSDIEQVVRAELARSRPHVHVYYDREVGEPFDAGVYTYAKVPNIGERVVTRGEFGQVTFVANRPSFDVDGVDAVVHARRWG